MSEDAEVTNSGYLCTCCGARSQHGDNGCSCADQKCTGCHRCVLCCQTPILHKQGYKRVTERVREIVPEPRFTVNDLMFLKAIGVSDEADNRVPRKAA